MILNSWLTTTLVVAKLNRILKHWFSGGWLVKKIVFALALLLVTSSSASAQTPFYQGKTITIIVGTKAGDAYDLYPRMLAEFMPKYIPGNPNIIIQNVAGAASMIAANQVYSVSKPDGLTLGAIYPALYFEQLTKKPEVKFDWTKFGWIGNPVTSNHLLYMRSDAPYKSMDDIRNATTAPKCGSNGITSTGYYLPKLMEKPWEPNSTSFWDTNQVRMSILPSNAAKSCAVPLRLPRFSLVSLSFPGASATLSMSSCRAATSATRD
jgi:tripartite-type tricarboxylate transporter receptor subunit TctC